MRFAPRVPLERLYQMKQALEDEMYAELSRDASGDSHDSIVDQYQAEINKIEAAIESCSEVEHDQYHWPEDYVQAEDFPLDKDDTDPAGGSGLASHV